MHRAVELPCCPPVGAEVFEGTWHCTVGEVLIADGQLYILGPRVDENQPISDLVRLSIQQGWYESKGYLQL